MSAGNLPPDRIIQLLIQTETIADKVLQLKQKIIDLDRCRQHNREALRKVERGTEAKFWITIGTNIVELEKSKALDILRNEAVVLNTEINTARDNQKMHVNELRDIELETPLKGFNLKSMNRDELRWLTDSMPGRGN